MRLMFTGISLLTLLAASLWPVPVKAQEASAPAGGAGKGVPGKKTDSNPPPAVAAPAKPKEVSPYLYEPKTPEEFVNAVVQMVDVARPALARNYLDRLMETELSDETLLQLRDKYGGAMFLRLLQIEELRPAIVTLVDRVTRLAERRASDPEYLAALIAKLKGTPEERAQGFLDLESAGAVAVPNLLQVMQAEERLSEHGTIMEIIARMGSRAIPVLVAALDTSDVRFRSQVASMLGNSGDQRAVPALWFPAFAESEAAPVRMAARMSLSRLLRVRIGEIEGITGSSAATRLQKLARDQFRLEGNWPAGDDGKVQIWQWNSRANKVVSSRVTPLEASDVQGLRYARAALNLSPDVRDVQVLFLALALSRDLQGLAWNEPYRSGPGTAFNLALSAGPEVVGDVAQYSLQAGRPLTAVVALKVLEQIGTAAQLKGTAARNTPFLQALNYPDARVQFAAASAILQVDPSSSFLGASRVVAVLQRAISNDIQPRAVVARGSLELASVAGGMFGQMGYAPEVVTTGRECFRAATERLDVQLIVLHPSIVDWPLGQTLANLRADSRTATIPIVIYGSPNSLKSLHIPLMANLQGKQEIEAKGDLTAKLNALARSYPLVTFVLESQTREQLEQQLNPFLAKLRTPPMTQPQRAAMKAQALGWMAHIASGRRQKVFNLVGSEEALAAAVLEPSFAGDALQTLGEVATVKAQQRLAEIVVNSALDATLRETATNKLTFHIQRFGLLVTDDAVVKLQRAQVVAEQPGLQTAFASLVGALRPNAQLVGDRLRAFDVTLGINP